LKADDGKYSAEEAQHRLEAALRGARIAGHKSMDDIRGKRPEKPAKKKGTAKDRP